MISEADVVRDLDSPDAEVRRRATSEIARLPPQATAHLLVRALGDEDWRVRKEATQMALVLGPSEKLVTELVGLLHPGDNVGLRNAAVETLAALRTGVVPAVAAEIARLDADGRKLAAELLGRTHDVEAMHCLEGLVHDPDPNVRIAAIDAVGDLGHLAIDAAAQMLSALLSSEDLHVRLAALNGLNELEIVVPWEQLRPLTADPILRRSALVACARAGNVEAASVLASALEDEHDGVFRLAVVGLAELALSASIEPRALKRAIGAIGPRGRERLLEALAPDEDDVSCRRAGLVVAAVVGEPVAVDAAIDALVDDTTAREADAALKIIGAQALPRILARIVHGEIAVRVAAIERLVSLVDEDSEDVVRFALRVAVGDAAPEVASAALTALGAMGSPEDISAVFAVLAAKSPGTLGAARAALFALASRYPREAKMAARTARGDERSVLPVATVIGALGAGVLGEVSDDVAFLALALSSADRESRATAVEAHGRVGSALGLDAVHFAIADEEREVRLSAIHALGRLRHDDGRPAGSDRLIELTRSGDSDVVAAAARALGETGDPRARVSLTPLVRSDRPIVAVAAVEAVGKLEDAGRIDVLLEATADSHVEVVKAALLALDQVKDPRVLERFGHALEHAAWDVRRLAADCLGRHGGDAAMELLRARLSNEQEPLVSEAIARALGVIEAPTAARCLSSIPPRGQPP